ncbi:lasso peptide biosynthesis B2 protein [Streptomyces sp. 43Y-GA-1]|uniref:lasso peptide biosynthesis B2 protein n=1 Tax=Streptomyces sp. 43Y-GA-1 TaxID=2939435 RepID=UPI0020C0C738|nr:lasso peptide biosynthesis B2 protein [Streptomyces sp. 43Y-GA-1]MCL6286731.1 lasso peptide biosynthesis B2 protein [Streptomyces sp. 43Y-GA-1]
MLLRRVAEPGIGHLRRIESRGGGAGVTYRSQRALPVSDVAATPLLAAPRLSVAWCHGITADPVRLHAWVQTVDGASVAEPPSTLAYTPALTIGARHQHRL